jgi:hypothetical protein
VGTSRAHQKEQEAEKAQVVRRNRLIRHGLIAGGVVLVLLVLLVVWAWRGRTPPGPPTTADAILRNLAAQMADAARNPTTFKDYFASGATLPSEADRKRYQKYLFTAVSGPRISGDTATLTISVRDDDNPSPIGQVEWTFVREGDKWKAKSAPLP